MANNSLHGSLQSYQAVQQFRQVTTSQAANSGASYIGMHTHYS